MKGNQQVIVVPGASSPFLNSYAPVYDLLRAKGALVLDYVGCGHYSDKKRHSDFGKGFSIPSAANKIRSELQAAENGSTLFCRSSGCDVVAYFLVNSPSVLSAFGKIIFWGTGGGMDTWRQMPDRPGTIEKLNILWRKTGVWIDPDFWSKYIPFEAQCIRFRGSKNITIAYGGCDAHISSDEQMYFSALINRHTRCLAKVVKIASAHHAVTEHDISSKDLRAYLSMIFG